MIPFTPAEVSNPYMAAASFAFQNREAIAEMAKGLMNRRTKKKRKRMSQSRAAKAKTKGTQRVESAPADNIHYRRWIYGSESVYKLLDRKTLDAAPMRFVTSPTDNDDMIAAPALSYFLSGFKLCATFRNTISEPIHVHMCIVQPKLDRATISDIRTNMLKDSTVSADRDADYVDAATNSNWNRNQDCAPLNPRKFNIVTHRTFILDSAPGGATDRNQTGTNYLHFEEYFKVGKRFEYEQNVDTDVTKPLWMLVYYETVFPNSSTAVDALQYNVNHLGYVRNINN